MTVTAEHGKVFQKDDRLKCFVIMPFGTRSEYQGGVKESTFVHRQIICPALDSFARTHGIQVETIREVDKTAAGSITKDILFNIAKADICIVDITGLNPNVFFELGIRYSVRSKVTILLKQQQTIIPFDIGGFRCISYECFEPESAVSAIIDFLNAGYTDLRSVDSLVFETFPEMRVEIPGLVMSVGEKLSSESAMSWTDWWRKVLDLAKLLRDPFENGRFVPSAVFGISNGGLMVADLLCREVFKGVPVLSLWADRLHPNKTKSPACYYFDNPFNNALVQALKETHTGATSFLLVDDIVSTGATIEQARFFLQRAFGEECEILFTPLYCRSEEYLKPIRDLLPIGFKGGGIFHIDEDLYCKSLASGGTYLPYSKVLGGVRRPYETGGTKA